LLIGIGGGLVAAVAMMGIGFARVAIIGLRTYAKVRVVVAHPVLVQIRSFSAFARLGDRGEELTALLARAFAALDRITQALSMLREVFTSPSRFLRVAVSRASRAQTPGN
jgi:hypothetical protein